MKFLLARALLLFLLGSTSGLLLNGLRPDGLVLQESAPAACLAAPSLLDISATHVMPAQASAMCSDLSVLVADARDSAKFAQGHVAGAVHLPCAASGHLASTVPDLLSGRTTVIVYGETTEEAETVADGLRRRSRDPNLRVLVLQGGFAAWENAGLACTSGACPDCAEDRHLHEGAHP